jgi:hypothetical protein
MQSVRLLLAFAINESFELDRISLVVKIKNAVYS